MKDNIYRILSQPYVVVLVMAIAPALAYFDRNYGYFFGLGVAMLLFWSSQWDWARFGFGEKTKGRTVLHGFLLALLIFLVIDVCIQPFLEIQFGKIDLSSISDIRGNFANFMVLIVVMWIFAAFGEEFLFGGYYMKHLAETLGGSNKAWLASAFILSAYFGLSHNYQGTAGIIAVALSSTFFFFTFYRNRQNLALVVLAHGFYDSIGLSLIHLNLDDTFYQMALKWTEN